MASLFERRPACSYREYDFVSPESIAISVLICEFVGRCRCCASPFVKRVSTAFISGFLVAIEVDREICMQFAQIRI